MDDESDEDEMTDSDSHEMAEVAGNLVALASMNNDLETKLTVTVEEVKESKKELKDQITRMENEFQDEIKKLMLQ